MNCCAVYVDDPVRLLSDEVRRTRRSRKCCECGEVIPAGALHSYEATKFDGAFKVYRTCARCRNVRDEYFREGWYYEQLREHFRECFGFDYVDGIPPDFAPCRDARRKEAPDA